MEKVKEGECRGLRRWRKRRKLSANYFVMILLMEAGTLGKNNRAVTKPHPEAYFAITYDISK